MEQVIPERKGSGPIVLEQNAKEINGMEKKNYYHFAHGK